MSQSSHDFSGYSIAAIVPAYNEEQTIARVVRDLKEAVPGITVYVYNNNSTDRTEEEACAAGAEVRFVARKGKGNVVRTAFADIDADIYVMIDGDDTYDASCAGDLIQRLISENLDHVLGCRLDDPNASAYRPGHAQGNRMFNRLVGYLFGEPVTDMLSGYRVFSRRFVKSFPALAREFEIETELTVHSMALRVPQTEVLVGFRDRPEGSESKLNTYRDGMAILGLITKLFVAERPGLFFGIGSAIIMLIALITGVPVVVHFFQTGLVPRLPTAVLAASLVLLAVLLGMLGVIMSGILRARREASRMAYLRYPAVVRTAA
ncbi:MAG: glycosyltransferase [Actinomycetaceae bacterium]|nr:glycosyltransferase [Actinomycetaceae bacterium]MDU0969714.1 glycosyltransferase [Actinomycetaceae bacterium]